MFFLSPKVFRRKWQDAIAFDYFTIYLFSIDHFKPSACWSHFYDHVDAFSENLAILDDMCKPGACYQ